MSQINLSSLAVALLLSLSLFSLSGCGDTNSQADLNPTTGKHPSDWLPVGHKATANSHLQTCTECHGEDFTGGISKIACTQCHLGNQQSVHPLRWGNFAYALHGSYVTLNDPTAASCMPCHGSDLKGAGTSPSCTSCHLGGSAFAAHPAGWNTPEDFANNDPPLHGTFVGANGTTSCRNAACHGADLKGVDLSGPSCNACHSFTL